MNKHATGLRHLAITILPLLILLSACGSPAPGVRGSGTVEATEITVAARTSGELLEVRFKEGEQVKRGDVLAEIEAEDIRLQINQQEQRLEQARAQLDILLSGAREEDVRQAEARLAQVRQAFELARTSYKRVQRLYKGGSATSSELDKAETEYEQARARVSSAEAQLDKLTGEARPEEIRAARAKVAEAQAGLQRLKRHLEDATITAPRSGTLTTVARESGEYVSPGTPLFTIADLTEVYLTIFIPEPQLGKVRLGQEAKISVDGMPERGFTGRVSKIAQEAEFTPKNVQTQEARSQLVFAVEISINNPQGIFKIGMPADARLLTEPE
jgi:HlyD family secretion protein